MVALHYSMLHRFEIFPPLQRSRTALLGCRLAALRLHEAARWQVGNQFITFKRQLGSEEATICDPYRLSFLCRC